VIPEWAVIVLAMASGVTVIRYFGGAARLLARMWIAAFYAFLWLGPNPHDTDIMATLSRYGLVLLFLSDIIPAMMAAYQRRRGVVHANSHNS
jgi:hypothetical protein